MYDLIIVGAGPGGATCAAVAARAGLKTLLLDKQSFPRDKVCGDAISGKSVDVIKRLDLVEEMNALETSGQALDCWGVTFSGPYGAEVAVPFTGNREREIAPGFICDRVTYDAMLFDAAVASGAEVWTDATVTGLVRGSEGQVQGVTLKRQAGGDGAPAEEQTELAPLVVGADGPYSVVARELGMDQLVENHYCAGLRWYWEGVTGFHEDNNIEIHFVDEAIPGYFWIFPMSGGRANVGLGMRSDYVKKHGVKLKPMLRELVQHPRFKERFKNATPAESIKGWGLPLGSQPRPMQGDGWMLVGDAASVIDPFTGEGIGNAMVGGERAAWWAEKAHAANDFSGDFLEGFGEAVMRYLGEELRISYALQRLGRWKWLLNTVIKKAERSPEVSNAISVMFEDETAREKLLTPTFYMKMLFA